MINLKKTLYLTRSAVSLQFRIASRRLKSYFFKYDILKPSEVWDKDLLKKLPYPVEWEKISPGKDLFVEIGSGHGELLSAVAKSGGLPTVVGFEIISEYCRVTWKMIKAIDRAFILKGNGYFESLHLFKNESIRGIYILFPDPWHKKKHHKRRPLVGSWFRQVSRKLKPNGFIFFATDWAEYYDFVYDQMQSVQDIYDIDSGEYIPIDWALPETHYYKKWKNLGREFKYIRLSKKP